jgi:chromosomal replication initiation ATPase DnaA
MRNEIYTGVGPKIDKLPPAIFDLIKQVADSTKLSVGQILGPSRLAEICDARRTVARILASRGLGYAQIGRYLGVDHSSVFYMCNKRKPVRSAVHVEPEDFTQPDESGVWAI